MRIRYILMSGLLLVFAVSCAMPRRKPRVVEERLYLQVRPYYQNGKNDGYMIDVDYLRLSLKDPKIKLTTDFFPHIRNNTLDTVMPAGVGVWTYYHAPDQLSPNFEGLHESIFEDKPGITARSRYALIGEKRVETNHTESEEKTKYYFAKRPDGRFSISGIFSVQAADYDVFIPISCVLKANDPQVVYQHRFDMAKRR